MIPTVATSPETGKEVRCEYKTMWKTRKEATEDMIARTVYCLVVMYCAPLFDWVIPISPIFHRIRVAWYTTGYE